MSDAYRAFIALPLPRQVIAYLSKVQHCLAAEGIRARWVRPEGMHLTLKFIGRLAPERLPAVDAVLDRVAAHYSPLQLTALGLGDFRIDAVRVFYGWASVVKRSNWSGFSRILIPDWRHSGGQAKNGPSKAI